MLHRALVAHVGVDRVHIAADCHVLLGCGFAADYTGWFHCKLLERDALANVGQFAIRVEHTRKRVDAVSRPDVPHVVVDRLRLALLVALSPLLAIGALWVMYYAVIGLGVLMVIADAVLA
jgi:hypothetical protein